MVSEELEGKMRALLDLEAIRNLARRYAHCVWQKDLAGAAALFTEDGEMDTGDRPALKGRRAIQESYEQLMGEAVFHPFVHNHLIELDGDRASGICYLDLRASIGGESMIGSGVYHDRYARENGEWKFRSRKLTMCYLVPIREGWAARSSVG